MSAYKCKHSNCNTKHEHKHDSDIEINFQDENMDNYAEIEFDECCDDNCNHDHEKDEECIQNKKKCQGCFKELSINNFDVKSNGETHSRCKPCRQKRIKPEKKKSENIGKTGFCDKCGKKANFNYENETVPIKCKADALKGMININYRKCKKCNDKAEYGFDTDNYPTRCSNHKDKKMISFGSKYCVYNKNSEICNENATHHFKGKKRGIYCRKHAKPHMVNVKEKLCISDGCLTQASFNMDGEKKGIYCAKHKKDEMVDVKSKRCAEPGCKHTRPRFNYPEEEYGKYCKDHQKEGMEDVVKKRCKFDGCKKQPSFNFPGKKGGIYCSQHAEDEMINVVTKRCDEYGCDKYACYNYKGKKGAIKCPEHAVKGMANICQPVCQVDDCCLEAGYKNEGDKKWTHCYLHAKDDMISKNKKKCKDVNCDKTATFGYDDGKGVQYCKAHKLDDKMIDLKHKKCEKCSSRVRYGVPGNKMTRCAKHMKSGMIHNSMARCKESDCNEIATFGEPNINKALFCEDHGKDKPGYVNLIMKKCKICGLIDIVNTHGICAVHDPSLKQKTLLQKQLRIKTILDERKIEYVLYDKMIDKGICNKRRPDFLFDAGTHYVVLEIDENQHKGRDDSCENARMVDIYNSLGMSVIFIRYNPDTFYNKKKQKIEIRRENRELELIRWINYCLNDIKIDPSDGIQVVYLFYDEYNSDVDLEKLDIPDFGKNKKKSKKK